LAALLSGAASCSKNSSTGKPNKIDYWTCTMHPSVREKGPGKCPICSMDLVPVMKESATPAGSSKSAPQHDHAAMLAAKASDRRARNSAALDRVSEAPAATWERHGATDCLSRKDAQSRRHAHVAFTIRRRRPVSAR